MPSLPDIPGKSLITGMTKRTRVVVATAGAGALAVGGFVAKRVLGRGGEDDGASADPIAETPSAPPGAERKPVPKPKPAKPKAPKGKAKPPKPKAAKPKPAAPKAKSAKPASGGKPVKPKAAPKPKAAKPPKTTGTDAPPKPEAEPGNMTGGKDPHHALNNPVDDPDLTEYPDPYETREDPRDPVDPDDAPFGDEPHPQTGAESTSEPPLEQDLEVEDGGRPPRREKLDD
jgi:hypothetical protein